MVLRSGAVITSNDTPTPTAETNAGSLQSMIAMILGCRGGSFVTNSEGCTSVSAHDCNVLVPSRLSLCNAKDAKDAKDMKHKAEAAELSDHKALPKTKTGSKRMRSFSTAETPASTTKASNAATAATTAVATAASTSDPTTTPTSAAKHKRRKLSIPTSAPDDDNATVVLSQSKEDDQGELVSVAAATASATSAASAASSAL